MNAFTWPPSEDLLHWRPPAATPTHSVPSSVLASEGDDQLPDWVAVPDNTEADEYGDLDVPVYALAYIELDAGRPGGVGATWVSAVPTVDGDLRIIVTNDDEMPMRSPVERVTELPTLGELLRILDATEVDGETWGVGHPDRLRNDVGAGREDLRGFVTIRSELYPQLEALDQARLEQWIAERP